VNLLVNYLSHRFYSADYVFA